MVPQQRALINKLMCHENHCAQAGSWLYKEMFAIIAKYSRMDLEIELCPCVKTSQIVKDRSEKRKNITLYSFIDRLLNYIYF